MPTLTATLTSAVCLDADTLALLALADSLEEDGREGDAADIRAAGALSTCQVTWMVRRDLPESLEAEESREDSWMEETFIHALRQRTTIGMVARLGEWVLGFMVYDLEETSIHLRRLSVLPASRHDGIAQALLAKLRGKLSPYHRAALTVAANATDLCPEWWAVMGFETTEDGYRYEVV